MLFSGKCKPLYFQANSSSWLPSFERAKVKTGGMDLRGPLPEEIAIDFGDASFADGFLTTVSLCIAPFYSELSCWGNVTSASYIFNFVFTTW